MREIDLCETCCADCISAGFNEDEPTIQCGCYKKDIKVGDIVIMNDNYVVADKNKGVEFKVRSEPFDLCGTTCVMLENYSGGYALDGLTKVN